MNKGMTSTKSQNATSKVQSASTKVQNALSTSALTRSKAADPKIQAVDAKMQVVAQKGSTKVPVKHASQISWTNDLKEKLAGYWYDEEAAIKQYQGVIQDFELTTRSGFALPGKF